MSLKQQKCNVPASRLSNRHVVTALICMTCVKILLIPSYRSTDFDVHRNWLAITKHLSLREWYFDDVNGTTVHTLDYPPTFAYFEYLWSSENLMTKLLHQNVDDRCFELLPDTNNEPSVACVTFQRLTVILSDIVLWIGAYVASLAFCRSSGTTMMSTTMSTKQHQANLIFLLIVTNPGLLYLDHVHFQYNGMLLGILLLSIGCLMIGFHLLNKQQQQQLHTANTIKNNPHVFILGGALLYALLLTMKHLYITLAPLYFITILRHYCYKTNYYSTTESKLRRSFSIQRFLAVALVTGSTLVGPFIPFLMVGDGRQQLQQIIKRLFPFGRGLVHDYWAGNIWAVYVFMDKCIGFMGRKVLKNMDMLQQGLPDVPPGIVACCLLLGIMPAILCSYKYNVSDTTKQTSSSTTTTTTTNSNKNGVVIAFLHGIVFCSLSAFMLAYHVHEKAIMTAIIPMTLLVTCTPAHAKLFWRLCAMGHFGLLPLLFRPVELPFKVVSYILYMAFVTYSLDITLNGMDKFGLGIVAMVSIFMEVLHPLLFQPLGLFEFLPLMMTSIVCAIGLIGCWIQCGILMVEQLQ